MNKMSTYSSSWGSQPRYSWGVQAPPPPALPGFDWPSRLGGVSGKSGPAVAPAAEGRRNPDPERKAASEGRLADWRWAGCRRVGTRRRSGRGRPPQSTKDWALINQGLVHHENHGHLLLTGSWKPKMEVPAWLHSGENPWLADSCLHRELVSEVSDVSSREGTNPTMGVPAMPSSNPKYLPKAPPLSTITPGVTAPAYELGEHTTQSTTPSSLLLTSNKDLKQAQILSCRPEKGQKEVPSPLQEKVHITGNPSGKEKSFIFIFSVVYFREL
ncbi:pleckstrin homology domain-containing family F member 1 isoform X2 [Suricata suricatta]|uniref:pleckstrin homology domain-containing family F member 1 isoform X2 n=1 Tax=Suricata suricatta TaxID=37032 RepID=UPI0011559C4A|nr:pleckstrin homology domain-containing family F member 1 isoform X2 [Suricata suricatta]